MLRTPLQPLTDRAAPFFEQQQKMAHSTVQTAPRKRLSHAEKVKQRESIEPHRFALIFDPPTVVLEYRDKTRDSLRHRKMQIPGSCLHDVDLAVNKLVRHNNIHLHPSVVSKAQVQRLVERLLVEPAGNSLGETTNPPFSPEPVQDPRSDPFAVVDPFAKPEPQLNKREVMTGVVDLQRADDDVVKKAKALMEEDFEKHALKPGDDKFVYDKRVEFEVVEGHGEWDDDDSDSDVGLGEHSLSTGQSPLETGSPGDDMYAF
jgi:hypothetical protein